jgi:hypothetical protein
MAIDVISAGSRIMDNSEERLLSATRQAERLVYDEVMKLLDTLDISGGKISSTAKAEEFLLSLEAKIAAALRKGGYSAGVSEFVRSFDELNENIRDLHEKVNGKYIATGQIKTAARVEIANTLERLTGSGLAKDFVAPIRQSLYRNVLFGSPVSEVERSIRSYIVTSEQADSKLMRYVKQAARDSVSQYDGSLQQQIAQELNLNALRYVGSLITDSRAQCRKWVEMGIIPFDILKEEIAWALRNGTYKGLRAAGMIPETTVATFLIYRGGWHCRHRGIPTFTKK